MMVFNMCWPVVKGDNIISDLCFVGSYISSFFQGKHER